MRVWGRWLTLTAGFYTSAVYFRTWPEILWVCWQLQFIITHELATGSPEKLRWRPTELALHLSWNRLGDVWRGGCWCHWRLSEGFPRVSKTPELIISSNITHYLAKKSWVDMSWPRFDLKKSGLGRVEMSWGIRRVKMGFHPLNLKDTCGYFENSTTLLHSSPLYPNF